jgi:glutamate formiminotransferase/formiminotetrahydrofolate cyclodeaminase
VGCVKVPFDVESKAAAVWPHLRRLAVVFNLETKSDLLTGIKCLETGIYAAYQNVLINLKGYTGNNEQVWIRFFMF